VGWNRDDLERGRLVWLLTLTIRGEVYRFSTEPIAVVNTDPQLNPIAGAAPVLYQYRSGLSFLEYEDTIGLFESEASNREVSLSVLFGAAGRAGWEAVADPKRDMGSELGELSLHLVGEDYQTREIIITGHLQEPTHGGPAEPVDFTLTESDWHDTARLPKRKHKVTLKTWPKEVIAGVPDHILKPADKARDEFYPWIFGYPGTHPPVEWHGEGDSTRMAATPGILVKIDVTSESNATNPAIILIAGHRTTGGAGATVDLWNEESETWISKPVLHMEDGKNQWVSYVSLQVVPMVPATEATPKSEFWVSWTGAGGVANEPSRGSLQGAGEIVRYLLDHSALRVDTLRSRAVLDEIDGYLLDFWINEPRSPWEIITEDILPLVPLSPKVTPDGLAFVYWNWAAVADDAVHQLDIDRDFGERISRVEVSPFEDVYNVISIEYCETGSSGKATKTLTYTHAKEDLGSNFQHNPYCYESFTRYGERQGLVIRAPVVEQDGTARAILDWKARFHCQTHRTVSYRLPQSALVYEVGDVVTLTHAEIAWASVVCLVTGIVRQPGQVEITFTSVSDWARDGLIG
tara:strand:+ start:1211 stop:2938 length:1728 start_codon:yes stop_codon:yes gene_type:complete